MILFTAMECQWHTIYVSKACAESHFGSSHRTGGIALIFFCKGREVWEDTILHCDLLLLWLSHLMPTQCVHILQLGLLLVSTGTFLVKVFSFCSGIHHKKKLCDVMPLLEKSQAIVKTYHQLYPATLEVRKGKLTTKVPKMNGGWGDIRDHNLCLNISQSYTQR